MANLLKIESPELDEAVDPETQGGGEETDDSQRHEKIAELAYRFWEEGGKQDGTAVSDWSRAENEYQAKGPRPDSGCLLRYLNTNAFERAAILRAAVIVGASVA